MPHLSSSRSPGVLALMTLLLAALVSVFLAGGPMQGGMGIFLTAAGAVLLLVPPGRILGWGGWFFALLLLVALSASLIPADRVTEPLWRMKLQELPALALPSRISLDPRATVFWVLLLSASLLILLYALASPLSLKGMELVALMAVLGCSVYAMVAWVAWQTGWHYPFFHQEVWMNAAYGFFPNRNQTAGFLLSGAVLSLGLIYSGMKGGRLLPPLIAACSFALLVSMQLQFSKSRGGGLFLMLGMLLWVAGLGRHRSRLLVLGALGVFSLFLWMFFNSQSELLLRLKRDKPDAVAVVDFGKLQVTGVGDSNALSDGRISIWRDTLSMISDFPLTGSGLGTYRFIYPFYADKSLRDKATALHAESDWLTLCAEGGVPSLLLVLGGLLIVCFRLPKLAESCGVGWPVRWAFLSAFFAEVLHGLVDVPFHKPELAWWLMLLGAIGCATGAQKAEQRLISLRLQRAIFIVGGVGMMVLGGAMIRAQWWGEEALPPYAPEAAQKKVAELFGRGEQPSVKRAIEECRKAIAVSPMAHPLYYQLGVLLLDAGEQPAQTEALFAVERALLPHDPLLSLEQGKILEPFDREAAVALWEEALQRQLVLLNHSVQKDHAYSLGMTTALFREMIRYSVEHPAMLPALSSLALMEPHIRLMWLLHPACDPGAIAAAVNDALFMKKLSPKEQGRLMEYWWERGDKQNVAAFLESHSEYGEAAVATKAAVLAHAGNYESACRLLAGSFALNDLLQIPGTQDVVIRSPGEDMPADPLAAAKCYLEHGNFVAARRLLAEAMKNNEDDRREALLLRVRLESRCQNWKEAYSALLGFLHETSRL